MKIYTRAGDSGETGLFGGKRTPKDSLRIEALGAVDEVNAALGLAHALGLNGDLPDQVRALQEHLLEAGADIAMTDPSNPRITQEAVEEMEAAIDRYEGELEPLRNFILPGGAPGAGALHLARSVCRRAERTLVALDREEPLPGSLLPFMNRLSDLLFVLARAANARAGVEDPIWKTR